MNISSSTARTFGANLLDGMGVIGGVVVGATVGRIAHARTTDRHGPASRLAVGVAAGLAAAIVTDSVLNTATGTWRSTLNGTVPEAPAASYDQARPRIAAQAATDAARKAKSRWYWSDLRNPARHDALWHGYEDGTATYYLAPGQYLRYQPDHSDLGTTLSAGWTEQYTLETGDGTTVLTGPAHLLQLLDSRHTMPIPADERAEQLARIVDRALAEQSEDDLTCASITSDVIQRRAAAQGIVDVTHTEAVDVINERLNQRRLRLASDPTAPEVQETSGDASPTDAHPSPATTAA
ncbi:hypothetical protein OG819_55240 [Streptomyces sp. NBC_01549]|uniref:hypothetical protein n=1 Tax=Streptomyces sp. NBC_01549 TaxID=2975874 RepID=UPI00224DC337|nr:hypothetical protein [Streptomyces sp. NBC_01549]MCX4598314.1 hypothetical protein [Streptomyces sp. NBC_01549]